MLAQVTLTVIGGGKDGHCVAIPDEATCLIGRGLDCDLRLARTDGYTGIHPQHCMVEVDLPVVRVHELYRAPAGVGGERNGDHVSTLFPETYEVSAGDEIRVGNTVLQVGILIVAEDCSPAVVL